MPELAAVIAFYKDGGRTSTDAVDVAEELGRDANSIARKTASFAMVDPANVEPVPYGTRVSPSIWRAWEAYDRRRGTLMRLLSGSFITPQQLRQDLWAAELPR